MGEFVSSASEKVAEKQGMLCGEFKELATLIIDNEASEAQKQRFTEFVDNCRHCSEYYQMEKSTLDLIKTKAGQNPCCCSKEFKDQVRKSTLSFK